MHVYPVDAWFHLARPIDRSSHGSETVSVYTRDSDRLIGDMPVNF